jgi:hypothetical protein
MSSSYAAVRKYTRYAVDVRAKVFVEDKEFTVRTVDVSEGGVGVVSPVEIPDGERVEVELVFPTMQDSFRAEVKAQSRNGFRYGFRFIGLDAEKLSLLQKFQRRWGIRAK